MSLFIAVPAFTAWARLSAIPSAYYPFLALLTIGLVNEVVSIVLIKIHGNNITGYNIYALWLAACTLWQFYQWKQTVVFRILLILLVLVWLTEWYCKGSLEQYFSWFIIIRSALICIISIYIAGYRIKLVNYILYRDAVFLICTAFIIYFSYALLTELYQVWNFSIKESWHYYIAGIMSAINFLVNCIYLFAVLCIPPRICLSPH
ncbi:hypothetical protein NIASO_20710 [Niabella soli DSM 19437]|uniref:Uncharacterized protein n=2 Tax=Niabella TaxID=379899 RepID=W0F526_9BACT|nr:hypothetical protein NIASO_20710 [Niabella soli DSM 19437]